METLRLRIEELQQQVETEEGRRPGTLKCNWRHVSGSNLGLQ
jgi:hypothetical protein